MLKKFKKSLRENQTNAEHLLWHHLRNRRFHQFKFRRQHQLQKYIVDFVCLEKKLIIELDGGQHSIQKQYDKHRSENLEKDGFQVLRFWNNEILQNTIVVLEVIYNALININK